ncbi:hypothetical protein ACFW9F_06125 [Streptomyces sp. NPDC059506]
MADAAHASAGDDTGFVRYAGPEADALESPVSARPQEPPENA